MLKQFFLLNIILIIMFLLLNSCANQQNKTVQQEYAIKIAVQNNSNQNGGGDSMKLTSSAFQNNAEIPSKYTCDGEGISPPLEIKDVPKNAKSMVLIMDDPDIPAFVKEKYNIDVWDHWILFNIPTGTAKIEEGKNPNGILGVNSRGNNSYGGPCPPDAQHRYFFKLFALDVMLSLKEGAIKKEIIAAMQTHILAEAELMGLYERNK